MTREEIQALADRLLACARGSRPADPAEREAFAELVQKVADRLGTRSGRPPAGGRWTTKAVAAALADLAAGSEADEAWLTRLARSQLPQPRRPSSPRRRERRKPRDGRAAPAVHQELIVGDGGAGFQVGGDATLVNSVGVAVVPPDPGSAAVEREGAERREGARRLRRRTGDEPAAAERTFPRPGLEIRVREERPGGETALTLELTAADPAWGLDGRSFGPFRLRVDPRSYVEELFSTIEKAGKGGRLAAELSAIGGDLFKQLILSEELAHLLWTLPQRVSTLELRSEEPWIPWELLRLRRPDDGRAGPFLCEAVAMTRWLEGKPSALELPLRRLAVVASRAGDPMACRDELADLLRRANADRSVQQVPAHFDPLIEALAAGGYDGWHFCGHGIEARGDPNLTAIPLDDHRLFTPRLLSGEAAGCGRSRPLVFLNGCHTGRAGWTLTSLGGWAKQFLDAGAGAFLGALWSIDGEAAATFSRAFYDHFCEDGMPFAKAVHQARQAIRHAGDATWLAYTAYGHPLAGCQRVC